MRRRVIALPPVATCGHPLVRRYTGLADPLKDSAGLVPAQQGHLLHGSNSEDTEALWGSSAMTNALATPAAALRLWLRAGFDPLLSLPGPSDLRSTEDAFGTDLSSPDRAFLAQSLESWSAHYTQLHLREVRLSRRSGAAQVGLLRDTPVAEDEADKPATTWGEDKEFLSLAIAVRDLLPDKPATLEQLELALRSSTPDQYAAIAAASVPAVSPHPYANVPTSARWHYTGDELVAWATEYQTARVAAQPTLRALRGSAEAKGAWKAAAGALADRLNAIHAVLRKRRERQLAAGLRKPIAELDAEARLALAAESARREASGVLQGELDVEETFDNSEAWLVEHEEIAKLASEPLGDITGGVSYHDFWMATSRLEGLEFKHRFAALRFRPVHTQTLLRVLTEDGIDALEDAESLVLRESEFGQRSGDVVPRTTQPLPAVWLKHKWWWFCGAGVVTQVTDHGSRQLQSNFQPLSGVTDVIALHYALRPLSVALDYATPFKYRQSVVRAMTAASIGKQRSGHRHHNDLLRSMHQTEDRLVVLRDALSWSAGVARRKRHRITRERLASAAFPVKNVALRPFDEATRTACTALGVQDLATSATPVVLGSTRTVTFLWDPIKNAALPTDASPVKQALRRAEYARRVGIEVSLWRKTGASSPEQTEVNVAAAEIHRQAQDVLEAQPELAEVAQHVAWELTRTSGDTVDAAAIAPGSAPAVEPFAATSLAGYEYVGLLEDSQGVLDEGVVKVCFPHRFPTSAEDPTGPAKAVAPGTYRLRIRCFGHDRNPKHLSTAVAEGFSEELQLVDVLPAALAKHNASEHVVPAGNYMALCRDLRAAGVELTTALEFEAGQTLDGDGNVGVARLRSLIESGLFAPIGARAEFTSVQQTVEPRVKAHWLLVHPGATEEEWHGVRRGVLDDAMRLEKDWWMPEEQLDGDRFVASTATRAGLMESMERYASDYVTVLSAAGASGLTEHEGGPRLSPLVSASYVGDGTVSSLKIDPSVAGPDTPLSLRDVLSHCETAIDRAHMRHNTLSASRVKPLDRAMRYEQLDNRDGTDMGSMHGRTYAECYERALADCATSPDPTSNGSDLARTPTSAIV